MKIIAFFFLVIQSFSSNHIAEKPNLNNENLEIIGNKSFAKFLSLFEKLEVPLNIDHSALQKYESIILPKLNTKSKSIESSIKDLKTFLPIVQHGRFSRMGPPIVAPLNRFYPDENTIAVTYLVRYHYEEFGFSVMLSLFDLKGNQIMNSEKDDMINNYAVLVAKSSFEETVLCTSSSLNVIKRSVYKNIWKRDVWEFGVQDNVVTNYVKQASDILIFEPKGKVTLAESQDAYVSIR